LGNSLTITSSAGKGEKIVLKGAKKSCGTIIASAATQYEAFGLYYHNVKRVI